MNEVTSPQWELQVLGSLEFNEWLGVNKTSRQKRISMKPLEFILIIPQIILISQLQKRALKACSYMYKFCKTGQHTV